MEQAPYWEANVFSARQEFPAFYGTQSFITAFTSAHHLSLSCASFIQSIPPHPSSWRSILLFSLLRLGLPSGLFPSGFPTKTLCTPLLSPIRVTCPAHPILLTFITRTILCEDYRSLSSSLCSFLQSTVTPSLLDPNTLLNTLSQREWPLQNFHIIYVNYVGYCTCVLVMDLSISDATCRVLHQSGLVNKNRQTDRQTDRQTKAGPPCSFLCLEGVCVSLPDDCLLLNGCPRLFGTATDFQ